MRISAVTLVLALGIAAVACGGASSASTTPDTLEATTQLPVLLAPQQSTVAFLGTLHEAHLRGGYPLSVVEQTIRNFEPDLVLVELPPASFEEALVDSDARAEDPSHVLANRWLRNKPELYNVVLPLRTELGYDVLPVSAWTAGAQADRDAYYFEHPHGPMERYYIMANAAFHAEFLENNGFTNPQWLHESAYLDGLTAASRWLSYYAEEEMGRGGELRMQAAHAALVEDAIRAFPGRRILIVFDTTSRWYLEPVVRGIAGVHFASTTGFLPRTPTGTTLSAP